MTQQNNDTSRRDFLKTGTVAAGAALATGLLPGGAYAAGSDEVRVGIIGCGGRGTGAAHDVLRSAKNVRIVALGDAFEDRVNGCRRQIANFVREEKIKELGNSADVDGRTFVGLDAYKKVIDSDANYIILATPPGFRPLHIQATVEAGKNLFTEKPVGVDGPGVKKVLAAYESAQKKKLKIAAGTQRRHQAGYLETMKRVHGGDIGKIVGGQCYWMQGILWANPRRRGQTDLEYQLRNWYNFVWLCGDHIVEQHVHNIDVINWAIGTHPTRAIGMGFKTRKRPEYENIYDFFATDLYYPDGVQVLSMCRQISDCANSISERLVGTKGTCQVDRYRINNKPVFNRAKDNNPYVQEHTDLITAIRDGKDLNELKNVAESTLTAIMGRMAAYTGKEVKWEDALNSTESLMPEKLAFDMNLPSPPLPVPGPRA